MYPPSEAFLTCTHKLCFEHRNEAILTCTHNLCFEQTNKKTIFFSSENYRFFRCEILKYITEACYRDVDEV